MSLDYYEFGSNFDGSYVECNEFRADAIIRIKFSTQNLCDLLRRRRNDREGERARKIRSWWLYDICRIVKISIVNCLFPWPNKQKKPPKILFDASDAWNGKQSLLFRLFPLDASVWPLWTHRQFHGKENDKFCECVADSVDVNIYLPKNKTLQKSRTFDFAFNFSLVEWIRAACKTTMSINRHKGSCMSVYPYRWTKQTGNIWCANALTCAKWKNRRKIKQHTKKNDENKKWRERKKFRWLSIFVFILFSIESFFFLVVGVIRICFCLPFNNVQVSSVNKVFYLISH